MLSYHVITLNTKLHENLSGWSRVVPCERTDGETWRR